MGDHLTVAEIRSAAAGDRNGAERLGKVVGQGLADPWLRGGFAAIVTAGEGPGRRYVTREFGWPVRWLSVHRGTNYDDLVTLANPGAALPPRGLVLPSRDGFRFFWEYASLRWESSAAAGKTTSITLGIGALGSCAVLIAVAWLLHRRLLRGIRHRSIRACAVGALMLATAVLLGFPRVRFEAYPRKTSYAPCNLTVAQAGRLVASDAGRVELATILAGPLVSADARATVQMSWHYSEPAQIEDRGVGWPAAWLTFQEFKPLQPARDSPDSVVHRFFWERNSLWWTQADPKGTERSIELNCDLLVGQLLPAGLAYLIPVGAWGLFRGRRLRRWEREGRCFTCGYELGWRPSEPAAPEASAGPGDRPPTA